MNGKLIVYLISISHVQTLLDSNLTINGQSVIINYLEAQLRKVTFSNVKLFHRQCDMIFNDETIFIDDFFDIQYGGLNHRIFVLFLMVLFALYVKKLVISHVNAVLQRIKYVKI